MSTVLHIYSFFITGSVLEVNIVSRLSSIREFIVATRLSSSSDRFAYLL